MVSNKFNLKKEDFNSTKEYRKEYIKKHHQLRKNDEDYNNRRKEYNRYYKLRFTYNIGEDHYKQLLKLAGNKCEICGMTNEENVKIFTKNLSVDHNHKTNEIRGILCSYCNNIEGKLGKLKITPAEFLLNLNKFLNKDCSYIKDLNILRKKVKFLPTKLFNRKKNAK
jgi:hypothetical protein